MLNQHNPRQTWHWVAPPLVVALSVFAAAHGVPQIAAAIRVFLICSFLVAVTGPPMALRIPLVLFNVAFVRHFHIRANKLTRQLRARR